MNHRSACLSPARETGRVRWREATANALVLVSAVVLLASVATACGESEEPTAKSIPDKRYVPPAVKIRSLGVDVVARPRYCGWDEPCVLSAPPLVPGVLPIRVGEPVTLRIHTNAQAVGVRADDLRGRPYADAHPRKQDKSGSRWRFYPPPGRRAVILNVRIDYATGRGRFQLRTRRVASG